MAEQRETSVAVGAELRVPTVLRSTSLAVMVERVTHKSQISALAIMVELGPHLPKYGHFGPRVQTMW
jgi:hypothetical protein